MDLRGVAWVPAAVMAAVVAALACRLGDVPWWGPAGVSLLVALAVFVVCFGLDQAPTMPHRVAATLAAGGWVTWVTVAGWSGPAALAVVTGATVLAAMELLLAPRQMVAVWNGQTALPAARPPDARPPEVQGWEALLQRLTKAKKRKGEGDDGDEWQWSDLRVTHVTPWPDPTAGQQVHVLLPEGMTVPNLADYCDRIAGARHLPAGCVVRVLEASHQGAAILDVMLRDCLAEGGNLIDEPVTATSIYEPFDVASTARGEELTVCLRQKSMVVGGTIGAGKTTVLHRIIMRLARCLDALIWVVDLNGGGVAAPWLLAWAQGRADQPTVDWVAADDVEAAVMIAVAAQVAKDRKTSREAVRRKRAGNTTILPVDRDLPAIVIIADEGGEIRQTVGLLAALVDEGLARVAQIARAEGVRIVMSVLRGTSDLLGKGLRTVAGLRICLRMLEHDEYSYVLGVNPGKAKLLHVGSAFVYRDDVDLRPVLARTVDVDLASIERHSIATAHLRPTLDDRARRIAARLSVEDVIEGRDPTKFDGLLDHPVMRDVAAGRAYEGRWDRAAAMLAELRGEDLPEDEERQELIVPARRTVARPGSAAERLLLGTGVTVARTPPAAPDPIDAEAAELLSDAHLSRPAAQHDAPVEQPAQTAREAILTVLRVTGRELTAREVHAGVGGLAVEVSAQRVHQLLGRLHERGEIRRAGDRYAVVAREEVSR